MVPPPSLAARYTTVRVRTARAMLLAPAKRCWVRERFSVINFCAVHARARAARRPPAGATHWRSNALQLGGCIPSEYVASGLVASRLVAGSSPDLAIEGLAVVDYPTAGRPRAPGATAGDESTGLTRGNDRRTNHTVARYDGGAAAAGRLSSILPRSDSSATWLHEPDWRLVRRCTYTYLCAY